MKKSCLYLIALGALVGCAHIGAMSSNDKQQTEAKKTAATKDTLNAVPDSQPVPQSQAFMDSLIGLVKNPFELPKVIILGTVVYWINGYINGQKIGIEKAGTGLFDSMYKWGKDFVVSNYTVEEAKPELETIAMAKTAGDQDALEVALTEHCIKITDSLAGYSRMMRGEPQIQQHALVIQPHDPEYAKFLLCLKLQTAYSRTALVVDGQDKEVHAEYGKCIPPYSVQKYLEAHSEGERIKKSLKEITTGNVQQKSEKPSHNNGSEATA